MNLLAPMGLFALLLLPVIIAIHMWRIRHRRHTLSSTLLWSRVLSETPLRRPRRIPNRYVLLLLQLGALTCGAVALARPAWVAAGARQHLLVAIDTSLAMGATDVAPTRLASAEAQARAMIDRLAFGDEMTIVDAGTTPRVLITSGDHAALQRALDNLAPGYGPPSLAQDGPLLSGLLSADARHARAYLFAPLSTPHATLDALRQNVPGLAIRLVGVTSADRGVAGLTVACAAKSCEAYARLVNTADHPITTRVTALVDGSRTAQAVTLPAQSTVPVRLTLPSTTRTVELSIDGHDPLAADDTAWAMAPLPAHRAALLVTNDDASALAQALHAIPNLALTITTPDNYSDNMTRGVDVTILDTPSPDLQPPGNLFIVNPAGADTYFAPRGTLNTPGVVAVDSASSLLRNVDLSSLVIASATRAPLPAWAHTDIQGNGGPLLFDGVTNGQRIAVLLFDPRPTATSNASNLASLLAFPALLQNAIQALAPAPLGLATAGAVAAEPLSRQGTVWLHSSFGRPVALASAGDLATLPALRPGLYTVEGGAAGLLAVNAPVPGDAAANPSDSAAPGPSAPALPLSFTVAPWEGWAIVCLLAMLILSAEWWYYARRT